MNLKLETLLEQLKERVLEQTTLLACSFVLILASFFSSCTETSLEDTETFKFNLPSEIHSLDPLLLRGTAKSFILFNVHRGLFYYNKKNELSSHGAKNCSWSSGLKLICLLAPKKWSDGSSVKASHYINTYKIIIEQKEESLLFTRNIQSIISLGDMKLEFILKEKNKDFIHELASVYFSPRKESKLYPSFENQSFSGPYQVSKLTSAQIDLINNDYYDNKKRPPVRGVFVDDPSTALNLYDAGKINFLRYLETSNVPKYKNKYLTPLAKLGGIFFNLDKIPDRNFRKALFHSLDYKALQKIFYSTSLPGCLPLPSSFFKSALPCYKHDIKKAQEYYSEAKNIPQTFTLYIPNVASNEHKKLAQWAKESWKKNLGFNIRIKQVEIGIFYEKLKLGKLSVYRKSVSLGNLTCRDAKLITQNQPEFKDVKQDLNLGCDEYFSKVLDQYIWLPLGMPSFANLHAKNYAGYYINMLGQFGLENLVFKNSIKDKAKQNE